MSRIRLTNIPIVGVQRFIPFYLSELLNPFWKKILGDKTYNANAIEREDLL